MIGQVAKILVFYVIFEALGGLQMIVQTTGAGY